MANKMQMLKQSKDLNSTISLEIQLKNIAGICSLGIKIMSRPEKVSMLEHIQRVGVAQLAIVQTMVLRPQFRMQAHRPNTFWFVGASWRIKTILNNKNSAITIRTMRCPTNITGWALGTAFQLATMSDMYISGKQRNYQNQNEFSDKQILLKIFRKS